MSESKFKVIETGDKEWPIEISNGEGFGIQMQIWDAAKVLDELHAVYNKVRWPELHRRLHKAAK